METVLRKIGNSKGLVVPAQLLKELGFELGDKLEAKAIEGKLVVSQIANRQKYKLADLLAKCEVSAPLPQELVDWDTTAAVGNEV